MKVGAATSQCYNAALLAVLWQRQLTPHPHDPYKQRKAGTPVYTLQPLCLLAGNK